MQAVVLAGGKGTRLAPFTTVLPKPLMPIGEMPVLEIILRQLGAAGFQQIEIATGYLAPLIEAYFSNGERLGLNIRYHLETEPAGTAGPLALLAEVLDSNFLIMNGDVLTDLDFARFFREHDASGAILTAATCNRSITLPLGSIIHDDGGAVVDYVEKPTYEFECSAGIYCARREIIKYIPAQSRFDLPDLVKALIAAKADVRTHRIPGYWLDIGTHDDYREANEMYAKRPSAFLPE